MYLIIVLHVADGDPIRLGGGPLHLVDLSLCSIGQDRDLNWLRHWLDIPNQVLVVISYKFEQMQARFSFNRKKHSHIIIQIGGLILEVGVATLLRCYSCMLN